MSKKRNARRAISPFAKIKHVCRFVEWSRSPNDLYALERCAQAGCPKVRTALLEEEA